MGGQEAIGSFRELRVRRQAMAHMTQCESLTATLPAYERYRLASQVRWATASVPTYIAEGSGRSTRRDYPRFLQQARGSLRELDTLLLLSDQTGTSDRNAEQPALALSESVGRLLLGLIRSLDAARMTS
jgi:four helix bundle protein